MGYPVWNCHVKVENATEVGLGWGVTDDPTPDPHDYAALITLKLPQAAGVATVVSNKKWETVVLNRDPSLTCGPNGIEAIVTYKVSPKTGANGSQVAVNVANNAGQKPPPTGGVLGQATGQVGQDITVHFLMQGTCD
jgi:hypothetical protein